MRLMIFSDIHGNLAALKAVFKDAVMRNVHRSICLGDIVGYGPFPNECLELIKATPNCRCLAGNHDVASLWETSPYGMSAEAREAILWTMDVLTDENKTYLSRLSAGAMCWTENTPFAVLPPQRAAIFLSVTAIGL